MKFFAWLGFMGIMWTWALAQSYAPIHQTQQQQDLRANKEQKPDESRVLAHSVLVTSDNPEVRVYRRLKTEKNCGVYDVYNLIESSNGVRYWDHDFEFVRCEHVTQTRYDTIHSSGKTYITQHHRVDAVEN